MPSNEGHIHWDGSADSTVNYLGQELQLLAEVGNKIGDVVAADPIGTIRIRLSGSAVTGLALPSDGWQPVPSTAPLLEARQDGHYPTSYIRVRQA